MNQVNHQIRLAARPSGLPKASDWALTTEPVPVPGPGEFVVAVEYVSIDPAMRRWIAATASIRAGGDRRGDGRRRDRAGDRFRASRLRGRASTSTAGSASRSSRCSDGTGVYEARPVARPATAYLGALGITGLTAYFGLLDVGRPSEGDTVVVSGAAGAVGSIAGQIAQDQGLPRDRHRRRRRRSAAGSSTSSASTPRSTTRPRTSRARCASSRPTASTSSSTTSAARSSTRCSRSLARGARIVLSGGLSQYNADRPRGPSNYLELLWTRASMTGSSRRLRRPLRRGARGARGLAARRAADLARADRRGRRPCLPRCPAEAVRRRERGQADPRGGFGLARRGRLTQPHAGPRSAAGTSAHARTPR